MKYTEAKINQTLKSLEKVKELREKQIKLTNQLETTLLRIQLALKPTLDFKQEIIDMKKIIKNEFLKTDPDKAEKAWLIGLLVKVRIKKKYSFIHIPKNYFVRWDDFIFYVKKTHKHDREHYIKMGEIEA